MRKPLLSFLVLPIAAVVPSCLTPDFIFEVEGDGDASLGGEGGAALSEISCSDGRKNGSETDEDCGGLCSPCTADERCEDDDDCQSLICTSGTCRAPTCSDRVKNGEESDIDCGGNCAGCQPGGDCVVDLDCLTPPVGDPATASCEEGQCALSCSGGADDCNGRADDGCETNLNTDVSHCGACGDVCDPDHATAAKCQGGECLIDFDEGGCAGAWLDCNGMPDDGCEVNTNEDVENCGDCHAACSDSNGAASCDEGTCESACDEGWADCDDDARSNGCEANLLLSATTCGGCEAEHDCPEGSATESPYCDAGVCALAECPTGLGDCDGDTLCTDDLTSTGSCGSCGNGCAASNATTACEEQGDGYACAVDVCVDSGGANYEDCDGIYGNGCETNVLTAKDDCGGCAPGPGQNCSALQANAGLRINSINCTGGDCIIAGCSTGYSDCDQNPTNGCETHIQSDSERCGGCLPTDPKPGTGVNCSGEPNTTGDCFDYACEIDQCALSFGTGCPRAITKNVDGSPSLSASVTVTYNSTNLVISATVTDTDIRPREGGENPWDADGIEIYLDLNNGKSTGFQTDDYQIVVPLGSTATVTTPGSNPSGAISTNASYASSPYSVQVTIPWAALGMTVPSVGTVLGFDIGVNDDDGGGGRDGQIMLFGTNQNFNNPSLWGTLRIN